MAKLSAQGGIAVEWVNVLIATIFVGLRFYIRWFIQSRLGSMDFFIFIGYILFVYLVGSDTAQVKLGIWDTDVQFSQEGVPEAFTLLHDDKKLVIVFKMFYIAGPVYYASLWAIKFALLILYYQLITNALGRLRIVLHCATAFTIAGGIISLCLNLFWCLPIDRNWTLDQSRVCWTFPAYTPYFVTLALHLVTDIMIYALPFPLLRVLQLSKSKRQGVMFMFALGSISILCTVGRAINNGTVFNMPSVGAWSATEQATSIVVVCVPPLKWFYRARKEGDFDTVQSVNERNALRNNGTSTGQKSSGSRSVIGSEKNLKWSMKSNVRRGSGSEGESAGVNDSRERDIENHCIESRVGPLDSRRDSY